MADLERFVRAQNQGGQFDGALAEITAGGKRGHWIWFVFPQIAGLGMSSMSQTFAIRDREEAEAYLRHEVLLARLVSMADAAARNLRQGVPIEALMGSPVDAAKLVSSMTLFSDVAAQLATADRSDLIAALVSSAASILDAGAKQGYPRCAHTLAMLRGGHAR
jgi:uncharacterized protein (DUF1810 family)